jgi:beta-xylosidase
MHWGWNHNPEPINWSLTQRPSYLRLTTVNVVDSLPKARNSLTQRMFAYYSDSLLTVGTVKMDVDNMKEGDIAGLALFQNPYAFIGVRKSDGKQHMLMVNNGEIIDSSAIETSKIYFRAAALYGSGAAMYYGGNTVPGTGTASFSYSLDNEVFTDLGNVMQMQFNLSVFTGNKFCLFNYSTKETGGYIDIDWFRVKPVFKPESK